MKVDGLHDGGNDPNEQVLSDGIGAWVTNLGRAELVSIPLRTRRISEKMVVDEVPTVTVHTVTLVLYLKALTQLKFQLKHKLITRN